MVTYIKGALLGSTPVRLRALQYKVEGNYICLRFLFDATNDKTDDLDAMNDIGTEIMANFPDYDLKEEVCFGKEGVSADVEGWQTAYLRAPQ